MELILGWETLGLELKDSVKEGRLDVEFEATLPLTGDVNVNSLLTEAVPETD